MYIIFEDNREVLRYFLDELPTELKNSKHIKLDSESDIPKKEGYIERATLKNDKLVWEYEEIKPELNKEQLKSDVETLSDALNEFMELTLGGDL